MLVIDESREIPQIEGLDGSALETDGGHRAAAVLDLVDEVVDAPFGEPGREDPVERGRASALLEVAEDGLADLEEIAALFLEERGHERGRVGRVGHLVADDEAEAFAPLEALDEVVEVVLEIGQGDAFLVQIDPSRRRWRARP